MLTSQERKNQPTVSIITAVKNCERTIGATINSVIEQSYPAIEHIIIDGASTDGTKKILDKNRSRFSVLISEPDNGIYDAMNKGLSHAKGDIVGILNADDVFADTEIVSDVVRLMAESGSQAVFGDLVYVNLKNPHKIIRYYDSSGFTRKWLTMGAMPAHPTLYLKREVYKRYGVFETDYRIAGDFEFVTRIFGEGLTTYSYLPKVMVKMNTGGASTKNLLSNWVLNREMLRACRQNNISTNMFKLLLKFPGKIAGLYKARRMPRVP
jgi:glycosyltransferase involved in cell wall biosynthesis